jgi:hypothetical protein
MGAWLLLLVLALCLILSAGWGGVAALVAVLLGAYLLTKGSDRDA